MIFSPSFIGSTAEHMSWETAKDRYKGLEFAKIGIVVVSISYRIGILGLLSLPMLDWAAPYAYNAGLRDMINGLEGVWDNIPPYKDSVQCYPSMRRTTQSGPLRLFVGAYV